LYIWTSFARDFRRTEYFKKIIKDSNILEYWQKRGFPDHCAPVGKDDFECEEIT
jgi:hypothetical protein